MSGSGTQSIPKSRADRIVQQALRRWTRDEAMQPQIETLENDGRGYRVMRKERIQLLIVRQHYDIDLFLE